ncbi:hypothetical protein MBLNU459_g0441t1 [Dothideomycetes sp. NU459]
MSRHVFQACRILACALAAVSAQNTPETPSLAPSIGTTSSQESHTTLTRVIQITSTATAAVATVTASVSQTSNPHALVTTYGTSTVTMDPVTISGTQVYRIGSQTLFAGSTITVADSLVAYIIYPFTLSTYPYTGAWAAITVAPTSVGFPTSTYHGPYVLTIGATTITPSALPSAAAASKWGLVLGSQTLYPNTPITIDSQLVDMEISHLPTQYATSLFEWTIVSMPLTFGSGQETPVTVSSTAGGGATTTASTTSTTLIPTARATVVTTMSTPSSSAAPTVGATVHRQANSVAFGNSTTLAATAISRYAAASDGDSSGSTPSASWQLEGYILGSQTVTFGGPGITVADTVVWLETANPNVFYESRVAAASASVSATTTGSWEYTVKL